MQAMAMRATVIELIELLVAARTARAASTVSLIAFVVLAAGCRQTYVDADKNRVPEAVARAVDVEGVRVDSTVNSGLGPIFPFEGEPVEVRLDARASTDVDGTVVAYRWLSATQRDGDVDRVFPEGEEPDWPADVAVPRVLLGEGAWAFSLWVTDDQGAISDPDTINLFVGAPPEVDAGPPLAMCMGSACDPKVTLPGAPAPSEGCCDEDNDGACGAVVDEMGGCEAVDQPGTDDPSCPSEMSTAGTMVAGCCTAAGACGVRSGVLRGCIERTDYPPGFLMSMTQLEAADCGGM
jgi:hypothetical protein